VRNLKNKRGNEDLNMDIHGELSKKSIKAKQEARQTNVGLPFQANIWGKVGRGPGKSKSGQRPQGYIK